MTVYRFDKRVRLYRRSRPKSLMITLALVILLGAGAFIYLNRSDDSTAVVGKSVRVSNDPTQTFSTEYFSFTAAKSWAEARDLSNFTDTFTYRKIVSSSPVGTLTINVNSGFRSLITNSVSLIVDSGKIVSVGKVSEHCSNSVPEGSNLDPRDVIVGGVSYRCWTDGTLFIVAAGQEGGGLEITLLRPNGESAKYAINYQSTSFEPDKNAILEILRTFEAR